MQVGIITLGCDKNTVDNEYLAGVLRRRGHTVFRPDRRRQMDALIITTCGFIGDAKKESIDTIIDWVEYRKRTGRTFRIIVIGCLAQLYAAELVREIPEIDSIAGVGTPESYLPLIESSAISTKNFLALTSTPSLVIKKYYPREPLDALPYGFLRISDGCNHKCSFCAIPRMKGRYRSVPREILLREARVLLLRGVREINIIGQDITKYGSDLNAGYDLVDLLKALCSLRGQFWIRLLYLYPSGLSRRLVELVRDEPKVCKYFDLPLQHVAPRILALMKRPIAIQPTLRTLERVKRLIPGVKIRTTLIVGFPGETEREFQALCDAVQTFRFDRLGVFAFSAEPGTSAAQLQNQLSEKVKNKRRNQVMRLQARISRDLNSQEIGSVREVLVESRIKGTDIYIARSQGEAPEVDGSILVHSRHPLTAGDFVLARVTAASEYDLMAEPVQK
jgi:ribosomal protein S12 methylthiotransferase